MLHILPYSDAITTNMSLKTQHIITKYILKTILRKITIKRQVTYLCNRVIIKCNFFSISNWAYSIYTNLVFTLNSSNSATINKTVSIVLRQPRCFIHVRSNKKKRGKQIMMLVKYYWHQTYTAIMKKDIMPT